MKLNDIRNENCIDTMKMMGAEFVDLVVTSPPYDKMREYEGYRFEEFEQIAIDLFRVVKTGGVVVWVSGDQTDDQAIKGNEADISFRQVLYFKEIGFNLFDTIIYLKPPRGAVSNNKTYWQSFEYMFVFSKGQPKTINLIKDRKRLPDGSLLKKLNREGYGDFGRRTNVWEYMFGKGHSASDKIAHKHPAIFPEKLAQDHILSWSNPGDLVYDPFLGSGTVALMAELNDRNFLGSEINANYCEIARERLQRNRTSAKQLLFYQVLIDGLERNRSSLSP